MEYYSVIKKNEVLPFATMWVDLEGIMLSEINQTKTNKLDKVIAYKIGRASCRERV